jgi:glycosyltransferase involved in cell wall biosynthesis
MRVWIEASLVARTGGAGSRRYASRLAQGLVAAGEEVIVLANDPIGDGLVVRSLQLPPRLLNALWAVGSWPSLLTVAQGSPPDVVHSPENVTVPPVGRGIPVVVTVHDTWCLRERRDCGGKLGFLVRRSWSRRDRWSVAVTPSEATRVDLLDLGFPEDRVFAVRSGVDEAFHVRPANPERIRRNLGLRDVNLVFVGPLTKKKGGDILLRTVDLLRRRGHRELQLVVRGAASDLGSSVDGRLVETVRDGIRFVPPLVDEDVAALYAQASVVLCPSRAEGYNFPLAEALSVGAVVIASDIPVHREVAQGAALLVPTEDPSALADGVETALEGERPEGVFTPPRWDQTVAETRRVYAEALDRVRRAL